MGQSINAPVSAGKTLIIRAFEGNFFEYSFLGDGVLKVWCMYFSYKIPMHMSEFFREGSVEENVSTVRILTQAKDGKFVFIYFDSDMQVTFEITTVNDVDLVSKKLKLLVRQLQTLLVTLKLGN